MGGNFVNTGGKKAVDDSGKQIEEKRFQQVLRHMDVNLTFNTK